MSSPSLEVSEWRFGINKYTEHLLWDRSRAGRLDPEVSQIQTLPLQSLILMEKIDKSRARDNSVY